MLKIEIGGGHKPRGEGFVNLDIRPMPGVDVVCDLEKDTLPWPDDSVDEVYSSHTLEHVRNYSNVLHEIARVCKVGAKVEIRVPHFLSAMAMCAGHVHVIPPIQVEHWCVSAVDVWWAGCAKRLKHLGTVDIPNQPVFDEARLLFPHMSMTQILRFIPDAGHEHRYYFEVVRQ